MVYECFQQEWFENPNKPGQQIQVYFSVLVCKGCGKIIRRFEDTDFSKTNLPHKGVIEARIKELKDAQ